MDAIHTSFYTNYDKMFANAVRAGVNYIGDHPKIETMIVGLSGGIDSFVTTVIAKEVCKRLNGFVSLVGYSLPIITNSPDEIDRARFTGQALCDNFTEVDLSTACIPLIKEVDNSLYFEYTGDVSDKVPHDVKIRVGNIKARLRMMYLYDKASKYKGMVLSTDNLTELLLGFWTLHGDVGDYGFIQNLWKTEVYGLANWMSGTVVGEEMAEACINACPTDGLGVSNSDLDQLLPDFTGTNWHQGYRDIDELLQHWFSADSSMDEEAAIFQKFTYDHPVIKRFLASTFKRENPINIPRHVILGIE